MKFTLIFEQLTSLNFFLTIIFGLFFNRYLTLDLGFFLIGLFNLQYLVFFNQFDSLWLIQILLMAFFWLWNTTVTSIKLTLKFELLLLYLLVLIGTHLLITSIDLVVLFIAFELIGLATYALVSIDQITIASTEIALKYLTLSALIAAIYLISLSLIIGTGHNQNWSWLLFYLKTADLGEALSLSFTDKPIKISIWLFICVIFFKLGLSPFHNYIPDLYSSSSFVSVLLIAVVVKFAFGIWLISSIRMVFDLIGYPLSYILIAVGIGSQIIGSILGLVQSNWLRLIAYSSISQFGWLSLALLTSPIGLYSQAISINFLIIYCITSFGWLLTTITIKTSHFGKSSKLTGTNNWTRYLADYNGLSLTQTTNSYFLTLILFSNSGIPPLAGFYLKYQILIQLLEANWLLVSFISIILTLLSTVFYTKLIKQIFFNTNIMNTTKLIFELTLKPLAPNLTLSLLFSLLIWLLTTFCTIYNCWLMIGF